MHTGGCRFDPDRFHWAGATRRTHTRKRLLVRFQLFLPTRESRLMVRQRFDRPSHYAFCTRHSPFCWCSSKVEHLFGIEAGLGSIPIASSASLGQPSGQPGFASRGHRSTVGPQISILGMSVRFRLPAPCGCSSVVEQRVANAKTVGSNPIIRSMSRYPSRLRALSAK